MTAASSQGVHPTHSFNLLQLENHGGNPIKYTYNH